MNKMVQNCWYFDNDTLLNTPSVKDDIDLTTELICRKDGADFISDLGQKLGLAHEVCATATVYYQRFYLFHSFRTMPKFLVAASCVLLASKVEESPKKCWEILPCARMLLDNNNFKDFRSDPRNEMILMERIILQTIKFDLRIIHPYQFMLMYINKLKVNRRDISKLTQMAWSFINDSFRTNLCLKWEPKIIGCAAIFLAMDFCKLNIQTWENQKPGVQWWESFGEGITIYAIRDICKMILDLHNNFQKIGSSTNGHFSHMQQPTTQPRAGRPILSRNVNTPLSTPAQFLPSKIPISLRPRAPAMQPVSQSFGHSEYNQTCYSSKHITVKKSTEVIRLTSRISIRPPLTYGAAASSSNNIQNSTSRRPIQGLDPGKVISLMPPVHSSASSTDSRINYSGVSESVNSISNRFSSFNLGPTCPRPTGNTMTNTTIQPPGHALPYPVRSNMLPMMPGTQSSVHSFRHSSCSRMARFGGFNNSLN